MILKDVRQITECKLLALQGTLQHSFYTCIYVKTYCWIY